MKLKFSNGLDSQTSKQYEHCNMQSHNFMNTWNVVMWHLTDYMVICLVYKKPAINTPELTHKEGIYGKIRWDTLFYLFYW